MGVDEPDEEREASRVGVTIVDASSAHAAGLAALFDREGSPCFCRYWHFEGDKNAWLDRCANAPSENRAALVRAMSTGSEEARGVVAVAEEERIVGWMKLAPAESLSKMYSARLYRNLPCFDGDRSGVYAVGCFLVDERFRGQGVAHALLQHGLESAKRAGARVVEAFPRRGPDIPVSQLWTGPARVFQEAGFVEIFDNRSYPVLRKNL